jgi:SAM-dependent methyltransferase
MKPTQNNPLNPVDNWDDHWKKYSDSASKNPAQKYRFNLILEELEQFRNQESVKIMDIGCGQGDLLFAAQNLFPGFNLIGLELSQEGVNIVKEKTGLTNIFQADLLNYANELKQFHGWADIIVCSEVLEHVNDPVLFLKTSLMFLKSKGMLIITVPGGPMSSFDSSIGHRQHFNKDSILHLLNNVGINNIKIYHAGFPWHNLFRLVVISRGKKLAEDVSKRLSWNALTTMRLFSFLFRFNLKNNRWGWQNFVVAWKE